jgi:hypothetical protein
LINDICSEIISEWPPFDDGITAESKNVMVFVTPHAFYNLVFKKPLQKRVNTSVNEMLQVSNKS